MPASQDNITGNTPMGGNLTAGGATFRVWAPNADAVYINGDFNNWTNSDDSLLVPLGSGHWAGFVPNVQDRQQYLFYVHGKGSAGPKRDPYARELESPYPGKCIIRDISFPWHETGYQTPDFSNFVIYQLHVGVFYAPRSAQQIKGTFLDVAAKIPYLKDLGITVLQLLPVQEYDTPFSMGYNSVDYFSPEMDFGVTDGDLQAYLDAVNALLAAKGLEAYQFNDLRGEMNQLKALVDLCHCYGLGIIFDQVYNHAGSHDFDDGSMYFMDRQVPGNPWNSLYFNDKGDAGGMVFDYSKPEVRDFFINNAKFFLDEYRVDGFRYDEVSTIDHLGSPDGWMFCQTLTSTIKYFYPSKLNHAEYWPFQALTVAEPSAGIGFNTTLSDSLRSALRAAIGGASWPGGGPLPMTVLGQSLWPPGFSEEWNFVQGPENQDLLYVDHTGNDRQPRMPALSDPSNSRSWYATSRSRVSTGVTLTSPGIPMFFMGQEFLEDKYWSDNFQQYPGLFIYWDGISLQKQMSDFLRFTRELIALRWQYPALRGAGFSVIYSNDQDRVLAYQRWLPGEGGNVVIVISLSNDNLYNYRIGFPIGGHWKEAFNSDVYENWVNPNVTGNGGSVYADNLPMHGLAYSVSLTLPANSISIFGQ